MQNNALKKNDILCPDISMGQGIHTFLVFFL